MKLIKRYMLFLLNLMIVSSLCFVNTGVVLAQSPAQTTEEDVVTPLFPGLDWDTSENIQKDIQAYGRTSVFIGNSFTAVANFPDKNPESIFDYYSSENLQSLGWDFIGGVGIELVYRHTSETFLTVTIEECSSSGTDYCINVWQSTKFIGLPNVAEPSTTPSPQIIGYNKTTPANGSTVNMSDLTNTYMLLQWTDALIDSTDRYQYCVDETNNNSCDSSWITRTGLYSGGPSEFTLVSGHTYYWQVRTRDTSVYANGGTWWSFTVVKTSISFNKTTPANGSTIAMPDTTYYLLQWTDALLPDTDRYQYCIDETNNNSCNSSWITRDSLYSGGPGDFTLIPGHTYYWQVRARDANVYANSGTWWSFTISGSAPTLGKTTPANGATIAMPATTYYLLQWTDIGLADTDRYQYCIDETNNNLCDSSWVTRDSLYSGGPGEFTLIPGHTYYWQVRARDANIYANSGTWWSFKISGSAPALSKTTPTNGSTIAKPDTTYYLLQWTDIGLADTDRYQYCIDETNNNSCDSSWVTRDSLYSGGPSDFSLVYGHTYYWQVRARDANVYANSGTWWSFTIQPILAPPSVTSIVRSIPTSSFTNASSVTFGVNFSQPVTGVDISDFTLTTTGVTGASITSVSGIDNTNTRTVIVNTGTGDGTIRLNLIDDDTIKNSQTTPLGGLAAGNGNFTTGEIYTVDRVIPTVSSIVISNTAASNVVTYKVTFSESVTGVDAGDFSIPVTTGTLSGLSVTSVSGSGNIYYINVNVGTGASGSSGVFRLDLTDNNTIKDAAANSLGGAVVGDGNFAGPVFSIWSGGISVTSDKNVVTVARPHIGSEIASYGGYSAGGLSAYVPMLFKDAFGGSYDSALYVQNTDSSNTASITIKFYDNTGTLSCTITDSIPALGYLGYWLPGESCLSAGWVGGAAITSDQPITAIGRPHIGTEVMTYNGFSSGSLTSSAPMLFKDAFGGSYDAALYVQNLSSSTTANISIKFYDSTGAETCTKVDTVAALASKGYWLPSESCLPSGWSGGAVITSDQPIVTVGRPHIGSQITTYSGLSSSSLTSSVPMLFKDAFGGSYDAALYVQNLNTTTTANISIKFYDSAGALTCTKNDTVAALASKGYWLPSEGCLPSGWSGGAVITSDQPIVTVGRPHIGAQITTYSGLSSGDVTSFLPMLFKDAFGGSYDSALYIQNLEATSANVVLKMYDGAGTLICTRNETVSGNSTVGVWLPSLTCP